MVDVMLMIKRKWLKWFIDNRISEPSSPIAFLEHVVPKEQCGNRLSFLKRIILELEMLKLMMGAMMMTPSTRFL